MGRGGLVYVKKDLSHEEAPRTFEKEQGSALSPWIKWAKAALSNVPLPDAPKDIPKGVSRNVRAAARHAFLGLLQTCGRLPVDRHVQVIQALAPALGWPWEGADGSVHLAAPKASWLAQKEGAVDLSEKSGWIEWATASVMLMKDPAVARFFLPMATIVQPWDNKDESAWCYGLLEQRWKCGSTFSPSLGHRQAALRLDALLAAIDDRLHYNPSPLGLPLHWQVAVRQLEKCLLLPIQNPLDPLESLPPVHTHVRIGGKEHSLWMGVSEWSLLRFGNMVHASRDWPMDAWLHFKGVIERDMASRDPSTLSLLLPFREHLLAGVEKFQIKDKATGRVSVDHHRINRCKSEVDAWWLECLAFKPGQSYSSSRPRRL